MLRFTDDKQQHGYVLPSHPKASGNATVYIEGYPSEDDEPMAATQFHARQIVTLSYQLGTFFGWEESVYVGTDTFIYYREDEPTRKVAPDVFVVFGVDAIPARRSFYTWAEGAIPAVAFEFLSEETARSDLTKKPQLYLQEIGMQEYFVHQPEGDKPIEFREFRRTAAGEITEIEPDARGWLFSAALNLWFATADQLDKVRLMRPHYPDGTPLPTHDEVRQERDHLKQEQTLLKQETEAAKTEAQSEAEARKAAEARAQAEAEARAELEAELERLRARLPQSPE